MKIQLSDKTSFICKSLLWSLLLYACAACVFNWDSVRSAFSQKDEESVVVAGHSIQNIPAVKISGDSLQRRINIAEGVISYLRALLPGY